MFDRKFLHRTFCDNETKRFPLTLVFTAYHKLTVEDFTLLEKHQVLQVWIIHVHQLWLGGVKTHKVVTCHLKYVPLSNVKTHLCHETHNRQT